MANDVYEGKEIRVCHKMAQIFETNDRSFTAEVELGGVVQNIVLSEKYVYERLACYNEGCNEPHRERSSYCSDECGVEDRGQTVEEMISPDS